MKNLLNKDNIEIILDYVSDGIQVIDEEGRIIYCNRTVAIFDDINREDAIGKHILDIYPSLKRETSTLLRVLDSGIPMFNVEQTYTNYKGKKITTINSTLPIKFNGKVIGAIEISRNITDVKALSEKVVDLQNKIYGGKTKKREISNGAKYTFEDIIGRSKEILKVKSIAMKAARFSSPILVYGDTGTGKELLVQAIHNAGSRKNKSFVAQNCAALPSNLLEGILFGTVKGSFTGAENRPGLFEVADGGTLFLDEINSMPLELQAKLLRVLQDGKIRRVGDIKTINVDVRIIAATNIEPISAIEKGMLRKDLYYRLSAVTIYIPDLKDRKEDIPLLTEYFIKKYNKVLYRNVKGVSSEVASIFQCYNWPGNVRELEHVIEGAMNMIDGDIITLDYIPKNLIDHCRNFDEDIEYKNVSLKDALKNLEKKMIKKALEKSGRNISKAASLLGIPRQTLQYKIKKYRL
ncbi:sigma-54 interaction domain-containing protein [Caminicella sporogenes]|uniref:sigma-54 interaction domain-containing protein n=1 Tax=Caminicella sporogenes TaxID=166485 RepID=UPI00254118EF|nr:sigma 54-interacting transcriptional regulator [Caminicella sporogenes]WIF96012.1 sigma 54-interacting transcriptional regulator [Caminicella sporogenes]